MSLFWEKQFSLQKKDCSETILYDQPLFQEGKERSFNFSTLNNRRKQKMWNKPTKQELSKIPALYSTDKTAPRDKIIHLHFFIGGCDWYVAEYDSKDELFFGFAILNNDLDNAEWGYFSLQELCEIKISGYLEVDRDLYFNPRPAREVEKIKEAQGW